MNNKTLRDRYAQGLRILGCKQLATKSSKFWKFEHPYRDNSQFIELTKGEPRFIYLGKAGAIRVGKSASDTVPCSSRFVQMVLAAQK